MPRATNPGSGWTMGNDSSWQRATVGKFGGLVTRMGAAGTFAHLRVGTVTGGTSPQVEVRNGGPTGTVIRTVALAQGNVIDRLATPDACSAGVYINVTGAPKRADIEVRFA